METTASQHVPDLHPYRNLGGHEGVTSYAVLPDAVAVEFDDGHVYLYNYDCPGRHHVEHMKALADEGQKLSTYISRHVGKRYAARLR